MTTVIFTDNSLLRKGVGRGKDMVITPNNIIGHIGHKNRKLKGRHFSLAHLLFLIVVCSCSPVTSAV